MFLNYMVNSPNIMLGFKNGRKKEKTITGQVLNSIKINKLKCINGLNEIIFKPHALTAILGPNGSGKSTILHAIASIYMPEK
ncbi:AAA family ATPase, partial [Escherichia coli]|nr:AAA family ATPase [Escherichia coli]